MQLKSSNQKVVHDTYAQKIHHRNVRRKTLFSWLVAQDKFQVARMPPLQKHQQ